MKKVFLVYCLLVATHITWAAMPIPKWVKNTPMNSTIATSNYIFVWGEGVDSTRTLAKQKAFADAVRKGLYELQAVRLSAQAISDIEQNGLSAATVYTNRAIRECCATEGVLLGNHSCKVYVLLQVQYDANRLVNFYIVPESFNCYDDNFEQELQNWNKEVYKRRKQEESKKTARLKKERSNWTNHINWSGIGLAYPIKLHTGINSRFGTNVGFGFYATIGIGWLWSKDPYYDYFLEPYDIYFHYEAGAKFYPYKGAFLSCGYGTIGNTTKYLDLAQGMLLKAGWDFNVLDGYMSFSVNGGVGYDIASKTWSPVFSMSVIGLGGDI